MKTSSLTPGTRNITSNVPTETYLGLAKLASLSGATVSEYMRALSAYAVRHQLIAGKNLEEEFAWVNAIKIGASPLPKVTLEIKAGPPIAWDVQADAKAAMAAADEKNSKMPLFLRDKKLPKNVEKIPTRDGGKKEQRSKSAAG